MQPLMFPAISKSEEVGKTVLTQALERSRSKGKKKKKWKSESKETEKRAPTVHDFPDC